MVSLQKKLLSNIWDSPIVMAIAPRGAGKNRKFAIVHRTKINNINQTTSEEPDEV
jgi:hypothetical protein